MKGWFYFISQHDHALTGFYVPVTLLYSCAFTVKIWWAWGFSKLIKLIIPNLILHTISDDLQKHLLIHIFLRKSTYNYDFGV